MPTATTLPAPPERCALCLGTRDLMAVRLCAPHGYQQCPYCRSRPCPCVKQLTLDDARLAKAEGLSVAEASFANFVDSLATGTDE